MSPAGVFLSLPLSVFPLCPHLCDGKPKRNDANAIVYRLKGIKKRTQSRSARREERFLAKEDESFIPEGDNAEYRNGVISSGLDKKVFGDEVGEIRWQPISRAEDSPTIESRERRPKHR